VDKPIHAFYQMPVLPQVAHVAPLPVERFMPVALVPVELFAQVFPRARLEPIERCLQLETYAAVYVLGHCRACRRSPSLEKHVGETWGHSLVTVHRPSFLRGLTSDDDGVIVAWAMSRPV